MKPAIAKTLSIAVAAAGAALAIALSAQPAGTTERVGGAPAGEEVNTGQDPTGPVTRVDVRFNVVEVGTMVTRRIVMSIEYNVAILKDLPLYKQAVELKVGYFF